VRLFIEESASFGVLGKTGRGVTEHFGISVDKIDAIAASMGNALASIGGFCVGRTYVIDHQVLSGAGYCYSASLPPLLAKAALEALEIIDDRKDLQKKVVDNARQFRLEMRKGLKAHKCDVSVGGWEDSPIIHLRIEAECSNDEAEAKLDAVAEEALSNGVAVIKAAYIKSEELHLPRPSIRVSVSGGHTAKEVSTAVKVIAAAFATSR
jgi:serine palmitoyltransferase